MKLNKKIVPVCMAMLLATSMVGCGNNNSKANDNKETSKVATEKSEQSNNFPKFQGKDFDGNDVDETLFDKNDVTLVNFWFNGCSACVNEMPALEKMNKKLKEKNCELIGANVEVAENEKSLEEAKQILSKQGATYRNISIKGGDEAKTFIGKIFGFPTTYLVDKTGKIIGEPIVGSIDDEKRMDEILKMVDDIKDGKKVATTKTEKTPEDKMTALVTEENNIFLDHKDVWDKVFNKIDKDSANKSKQPTYDKFLDEQVEKLKDTFSEDELKTLKEDIKKIGSIEKQIQELNINKDSNK